jgi:tyrosine-protein kinase Etk/Wzc
VETNTKMYLGLLDRVQQLRIAKAGTVGNIRVIDPALPSGYRIAPVLQKMLTTAGTVGLALAIGLVFLRRLLSTRLEDADQIERQLGLPVYAVIPHSAEQVKIYRTLKRKKGVPGILVEHAQDDVVAESFRSLRTSLHFALMDARSPTILITGPTEEVGKSFIAANLAAILAKSGERVLLIDGDLRKGHLNKYLGLSDAEGLSDWLSGRLALEQVIHNSGIENLDFIPVGKRPPNPSELLLQPRLAELMALAGKQYAQVIVDGPPILAVTDAAIIGRLTGATLLVARSGRHHINELELSVKRLQQGGINVRGFVFNGVPTRRRYGYYGRYRYGYGYGYGYRYKPYSYGYSYKSKR